MAIRDRIRQAIRDRGVSQYELARWTGIDESQLSRYLRGLADLPGDRIDRLIDQLGLDVGPAESDA